jgi:hypothetical protein
LFHLSQDRIEMPNIAKGSHFSAELEKAREAYCVQLAALKAKVVRGHGYEPCPVLFAPVSAGETKEPLLKSTQGHYGSEAEDSPASKNSSKPSNDKRKDRKAAKPGSFPEHQNRETKS